MTKLDSLFRYERSATLHCMPTHRKYKTGFSLIELSIVLLIVGIVASAAVQPLSSTIRQSRIKQTQTQLELIKQAMHGYLAGQGRLPCPLVRDEINRLNVSSEPVCTNSQGGLPGVALGIMGAQSESGALLDAWGREYRFAVSLNSHESLGRVEAPDWLSVGELPLVGVNNLSAELELCRVAVSAKCSENDLIANQIVWVVLSSGPTDLDKEPESENSDNDSVFAISSYSTNSEKPYDDQLVWASRSELIYWMLKSNLLP